MSQITTWNRRLYFSSEGKCAEDIFALQIRRLRPGFNPRTGVPEASTLTPRPPKPLRPILLRFIPSGCVSRTFLIHKQQSQLSTDIAVFLQGYVQSNMASMTGRSVSDVAQEWICLSSYIELRTNRSIPIVTRKHTYIHRYCVGEVKNT